LTWANDAKNFKLAPVSDLVKNTEIDGAASVLNLGELDLFDTWFTHNNQTWVAKAPKFDSSFKSNFVQHPTWFLRYWEIFYINSTNYWSDFDKYLTNLYDLQKKSFYEPNFQIMGNFGETEKLFLLNIDPFSQYILLADFSNYFYNVIYNLYFNLSHDLNVVEKSYGSLNFRTLFVDMAVHSNNEISDSDDSTSHLTPFRKKLEQSNSVEQVYLISSNLNWYPIHRKKPDAFSNFRSNFFNFLKNYMINHRDLILLDNTDDLLLEQLVMNFNIQVLWAEIKDLQFSETFNQVAFRDITKSDNSWKFNRDLIFFAWSDPTSYLWSYYLPKFDLQLDPFISSTMDDFFLMKPYFKWTQITFFRLFEFIISDLTLQVKTKLIVIPNCLAKGKLYTEIEVWTFYAPIVEEILERPFGFYDQFNYLCFFFPKKLLQSS
jgi:hypothetical protein